MTAPPLATTPLLSPAMPAVRRVPCSEKPTAGISALLKFVVSSRKAGNKLFAMNVSPHHQKIFKMVEMSRFMPTIEERDLAAYR